MLLIAIAEGDGPWRTDVIAEALRRWLFISDQGGVETFYAAEEQLVTDCRPQIGSGLSDRAVHT
jgi:hypothetical protein